LNRELEDHLESIVCFLQENRSVVVCGGFKLCHPTFFCAALFVLPLWQRVKQSKQDWLEAFGFCFQIKRELEKSPFYISWHNCTLLVISI
jgi:hypothetical protein